VTPRIATVREDAGLSSPASTPREWRSILGRVARALLPLGLLVLLVACAEHPRDTLNPAGDSAEVSAWFFWLYLILDAVIFAIVGFVFIAAIVKFRRAPGDDTLPPQDHGNMKLELMWTVIPTIIVVVLGIITVGGVFQLDRPPPREQERVEIDLIGKQWWWEYDYTQHGFTTANEMHVEEGTVVVLNMTSADVIHAWWVPRVSGKRDATPGRTYPMHFTPKLLKDIGEDPTKVKQFVGQCAELCGASHAHMGLKLFVHPKTGPNNYDNWVAKQKLSAAAAKTAIQEKGKKLFSEKGCVACHNIKGHFDLAGRRTRTTGPDLTHVGGRTTIAANTLPNDVANLAKWIKNPQAVKEAATMTNLGLNDEESTAIAEYLFNLK
jgi:cytochrome c oxidase subunit II